MSPTSCCVVSKLMLISARLKKDTRKSVWAKISYIWKLHGFDIKIKKKKTVAGTTRYRYLSERCGLGQCWMPSTISGSRSTGRRPVYTGKVYLWYYLNRAELNWNVPVIISYFFPLLSSAVSLSKVVSARFLTAFARSGTFLGCDGDGVYYFTRHLQTNRQRAIRMMHFVYKKRSRT